MSQLSVISFVFWAQPQQLSLALEYSFVLCLKLHILKWLCEQQCCTVICHGSPQFQVSAAAGDRRRGPFLP